MRTRKTLPILLIAAGLVLIVIFILAALNSPADGNKQTTITVTPGTSSSYIAAVLQQQGILKNKIFFQLKSRLSGTAKHIQIGVYVFTSDMRPGQMVKMLRTGKVSMASIQLTPGMWMKDAVKAIGQSGICPEDEFLAACTNKELLTEYGIDADSAEGFLYPDTYYFRHDESAEDILRRILDRFYEQCPPELQAQMTSHGISLYEALIIASIVQLEVRDKYEYERPVVAAVYLNRLMDIPPMRLESCPTILYALGYHKDRILLTDLEINSPYNTYKHAGLPPTPICSPGKKAMLAVAFPANVDYKYFVAYAYRTIDGAPARTHLPAGSHYFSRTYAEHLTAKKRYQEGYTNIWF